MTVKRTHRYFCLLVVALAGCDILIPPGGEDGGGAEVGSTSTGGIICGGTEGGYDSDELFICSVIQECGDEIFSVTCDSRTECICTFSDSSEGGSVSVVLDDPLESCVLGVLVDACGFDVPGLGGDTLPVDPAMKEDEPVSEPALTNLDDENPE